MFFQKRVNKPKTGNYDHDKLVPIVRASICNGEQVAGFKDKETGEFRDETLITGPEDLEKFKIKYGISEIKVEY